MVDVQPNIGTALLCLAEGGIFFLRHGLLRLSRFADDGLAK